MEDGSLWSHFLAAENVAFLVALGLFLVLGLIQVVSFVLGASVFSFLDHHLPDADFDAGAPTSGFAGVLSFLGLGRVPFAISLFLFLFLFSCVGYNLQLVLATTSIGRLSALPASLVALVVTLPLLRFVSSRVSRILPKDESLSVSEETFVGKLARITLGTVTRELASEARLEDDHGHAHYVQVIAENAGEVFKAGQEVIIVGRAGTRFTVVRGPDSLLLEE